MRDPAGNTKPAADQIRIGVLELKKGDPHNRYLLLGIDRTQAPTHIFRANLKEFGFTGDRIEAVEPKFLFSMNRTGPVDVYSFDVSTPDLSFISQSNDGKIVDSTLLAPAGKFRTTRLNRLPTKILEVGKARDNLLLKAAFGIVLEALKFAPTPLSLASRSIVVGDNHHRSKKDVEAQWLQFLVTQALEYKNVPELTKYMTDEQLRMLGSELSIQFNREWKFGGLGASRSNAIQQYDDFTNARKGYMATNFARLSRIANMQGFLVVPTTSFFAVAYADPQWLTSPHRGKKDYNSEYLTSGSPERLSARYKEIISENELIPIGVFALNESGAPLQMIDFNDPLKFADNERVKKTMDAAKEIGYAFISIPALTMGLSVAEGVIKFVVRKHGSTIFDYRVRAAGELQAAIESGLVEVDSNAIMLAAIADNLANYGFPPEQIEYYQKTLQSPDPDLVKQTTQDILAIMAQREERFGRLVPETADDQKRRQLGKYVWMARLKFRLESQNMRDRTTAALENLANKTEQKLAIEAESRSRKVVSSETVLKQTQTPVYPWNKEKITPVILFMVDGLRPDRLKSAVRTQHLPYLNEFFVKRGVEFEAYSPRSITLPSWASALTGFEIDEHGLKSNTPVNRFSDGRFIESYLDYRKELFFPKYWAQGRSYKHLSESGVNWLPRYYFRDETLLSYMPINDGEYPPLGYIAKQAAKEIPKFLYQIHDSGVTLDLAQSKRMASLIRSQAAQLAKEIKGKTRESTPYRFVALWLASVDHFSHDNSHRIDEGMRTVDESIGLVIEAAKSHPTLKDAFVYLVSDHGHTGGPEEAHAEIGGSTAPHAHFLDNTQFNLTHFFAGDFVGFKNYRFNVGAPESPEPEFDLKYLAEFFVQPFRYTYPRKNQERDVLLDYSGDSLAQIYLRPAAGWGDERRYTYAELKNFKLKNQESASQYDLVSDLFRVRLNNLESATDRALTEKIRENSAGGRPVEYLAMALQGADAKRSAAVVAGLGDYTMLTREPVLVVDRSENMGLILSREALGETIFSYLSIRDFQQDTKSGAFTAQHNKDFSKDPLRIASQNKWKSDREWISHQQSSRHPTLIPSLARILTQSKRIAANVSRRSEIPDFILTSSWGFNFNGSYETQSDHGGLLREEVRSTFIMSRIGERAFPGYAMVNGPVLLKDIAPTVLDTAGMGPAALTSGKSLRPIAEAVLANPQRKPASDDDAVTSTDHVQHYFDAVE